MEGIPIPIVFSLVVVMLMVLISRSRKKHNTDDIAVPPPGPWKFPILGNLPQLFGAPPHQRLSDLAKVYGPVMSIQQGQHPAVVISSVETAKEVLKTQGEAFAGRPLALAVQDLTYNCMDIMFAPYGDYWRQMRKICTLEFLSPKRVQSFRSTREEQVSNFIKFVAGSKPGSPVNLTDTICDLTNSIMLITTLGKNGKGKESLISMLENVKETIIVASIVDLFPSLRFFLQYLTGAKSRIKRVHQEMDKLLEDILIEHKANKNSSPHDDLLNVLLDLQKNQGDLLLPLTNESIKANVMELFSAGSHTSSKVVEWAMTELMKNPEAMKKAQDEVRGVFGEKGKVEESRIQELKYLKLVIKETFRLHPPSTFILRECIERTKVGRYDIYPKTRLLVNVWAIGRDPNVWNDAEKFYPERFENSPIDYKGTNMELIPFGAGKRICPGISLAVTYVELLLANLLYHFDWKLPHGITPATLDMTEILHGTLNRKQDLNLIPIPFSPLPEN